MIAGGKACFEDAPQRKMGVMGIRQEIKIKPSDNLHRKG